MILSKTSESQNDGESILPRVTVTIDKVIRISTPPQQRPATGPHTGPFQLLHANNACL
jgi:hypothetical protein